jgi:hypothetical protein
MRILEPAGRNQPLRLQVLRRSNVRLASGHAVRNTSEASLTSENRQATMGGGRAPSSTPKGEKCSTTP